MLERVLPFVSWLRGYSLAKLRVDGVAGLTVALVLIPQSMAYAQLAGLPPFYGLYASLAPPLVAALFGSSRQLATGPVAVVSLMTAASLAPLATAGSEAFVAYAVLLSLVVGVFQLSLGLLRLGLVVNFLSHPVVNGFTNGAAIIIATSQLSKVFGVHVDSAEHHYETIYRVGVAAAHYVHWATFALGVGAFGVMYLLKRLNPRIPYVLVAVVITTALSWLVGFRDVREVPLDRVDSDEVQRLVRDLNEGAAQLEDLGTRRAEIGAQLAAAGEGAHGGPTLAALEARHRQAVVALEIEAANRRVAEARAALRRVHLTARGAGPAARYAPRAADDDGQIWRVHVGRGRLDVSRLRLSGGGDVVGDIPSGLPSVSAPDVDLGVVLSLLPSAVIISLLGFMEAISIAKAMTAKTGQRLDPNQELIGQGLGNIAGAFSSAYPVSGSFSRSAVNLQAGAQTGISSVVTSVTVMVVLLFLTPLLFHLPQSVLAAVIMMAVMGLINVSGFVHAWKAQWYDGLISVLTFVATLAFAPHLDRGIMLGVALSLSVFLYKSMRPRVACLSMDARSLRDAERFGLQKCNRVAVIRFGGPLFFANASFLEDQVTRHIERMPDLREIVIAGAGINEMDASGEEALSLLVDRVRAAGYTISICELNEDVTDVLARTYLRQKIGDENIYPSLADALEVIHPRSHDDGRGCPLAAASSAVLEREFRSQSCR
jgi:MFS superfamily sulfate permease-like transporter